MAENTIGAKLELTGEQEFNRQMTEVNNTLKTSRSDLSVLSAQYAENANSAEAYRAKQKALDDIASQSQAKTEALRKHYEEVAQAYGENSAQAQKYKQQLNAATVAEIKAAKAAEDNGLALQRMRKLNKGIDVVVDATTKALNKMATAAGLSNKSLLSFAVSVPIAGAKNLAKFTAAATGAAAALTAVLGGAALAGITKMVSFANEAAAAAKAAADAGQPLSQSQKQWLAYSDNLEGLNAAAASAKSAIGSLLLPALNDLSTTAGKYLSDFSRDLEAAGADSKEQSAVISKYIAEGAKLIKSKLPEYADFAKELIASIGSGIADAGSELIDTGADIVLDILDGIIQGAPKIADGGLAVVEKLAAALIARGPDLMTSAVSLVTSIVTGLASAAPRLIPMAADLVKTLAVALIKAAPELLKAGGDLLKSLADGLLAGLSLLGDAADEIIEAVRGAFGDGWAIAVEAGFDFVKALFSGVSGATSWLYNALSGWITGIIGYIKGKFKGAGGDSGGAGASSYSYGSGSLPRINSYSAPAAIALPSGSPVPQAATINLTFQAQTITQTDMDMIVSTVNRRLGIT